MSMLAHSPVGAELGDQFALDVFAPTAEAFSRGDVERAVELFIGGVLDDRTYFSNASREQKALMLDNTFELRGIMLTEQPFPSLDCEAMGALQTPTLLIKGDRSPTLFGEIADVLAKCIEGSELVVLPNASHGLEYENPEGFNRIVLDFIDKH